MECAVLEEEKTLWNLQRLFVNSSCISSLYGKYAVVNLSESEKYVCRIYHKNTLHSRYCILDKSVRVEIKDGEFCKKSDVLMLSNIKVIPQVNYIKSLTVSVVFGGPQETIKWKDCLSCLCPFVKDILKLFVLINDCIISVEKLDCADKLKVRCILVHKIGSVHAGKVVDLTKLKIESVMSYEKYKQTEIMEPLSRAILLKEPYNRLKEFLQCQQKLASLFNKPTLLLSPQILLIGPSGCGKKTLIKQIASDCGIVLISLDGTEATRPNPGDTELFLKTKFQEAVDYTLESIEGQCILLLSNLEAFCKKSSRMMISLITLLDSVKNYPGLVVIGTTNKPHLLHQALQSSGRLHYQLYFGIPTELERVDILKGLLSEFNLSNNVLESIANLTPGFILADLILLAQNIYRQMIRQKSENVAIFNRDELIVMIHEILSTIEPSTLRGELGVVDSSRSHVKQLGGVENIELILKQAILWPLLRPQAFKALNISQTCGVLLYGPPGCAKTSLVCSIAASYKCTFLAVSAADLYSPYVGDAEKTISHLFQRARAASPTILFIDEIDALVGSRGGRETGSQERVLSSFLTEMDGVGVKLQMEHVTDNRVFVVAATNRPNVLDSALLRPGRFDRLIYVPAPNTNERLKILSKLTERMPLDDCVDLKMVSENTKLYSGADLNNLCREAAMVALTEEGMSANKIKQKHWDRALKEMYPSLTLDQIKWYDKFNFSS